MIASLNVENIALIDHLEMEFGEGLNVLSGETGAGKSVLLDAVNLILGERAERGLIRHGEDHARVEAVIYPDSGSMAEQMEALGIPFDQELIVTRDLTSAGRSICRVNGHAVTLAALKDLMAQIIDLHGQHEHQSLLNSAYHTTLLDALAGRSAFEIHAEIRKLWAALRDEHKLLERLGGDPAARDDKLELLRFQLEEVQNAQIVSGELERLELEQKKLDNAEQMQRVLLRSNARLYGDDSDAPDAVSMLRRVADDLGDFAEFDDRIARIVTVCEEAYCQIEDVAHDLSAVLDSVEKDEEHMAAVEERIDEIRTLLRKYRALDEEELIAMCSRWQNELTELEQAETCCAKSAKRIEELQSAIGEQYRKLSALRHAAAQALTEKLLTELSALGMPNAQFETRFCGLDDGDGVRYGPSSPEMAEFYLTVNRGEPLKPLAKVASGGEISRIMLAFKIITAAHDEIGTLIFDEIDTGISGRTAQVVGEKMAQLGRARQVITVTHLPQIAAMGDHNFYIYKDSTSERTSTHIDRLDEAGIRNEIVRLTGGIESDNADQHAQEMMAHARAMKEKLRGAVPSGA